MLRNTNTEKWKDAWFTGLQPTDKLVFIFLTENCDLAGFYEINLGLMTNLIGIKKKDLIESLGRIQTRFIPNAKESSTRKLWLKKYLLHQDCLPLKSDNEDHMKIKFMLESNYEDFDCPIEMLQIIESVVEPSPAKKSGRKKAFVAPSWEEWWEYYKERYDNEEAARGLFDHYISVGWTIGANKKMSDWQAAIRKNIPRHKQQHGDNPKLGKGGNKTNTRTDNLKNASEEFLNDGMAES